MTGDGDRLGGDDKKPAPRDRHHHVPHQGRDGVRYFEPPKPAPWREMVHARGFDQLARDGAQRLVDAERHVPRLRREDRKDRGAFDAQQPAREQRDEPGDGDRQKPQDRHRLEDVEQRDQDLFGLAAFRRERGIGEAEDERGDQRPGHAQHGAQRVCRQRPRVEADRQRLAQLIAHAHRRAAPGDQRQEPEHQRQRHKVPDRRPQPQRPSYEGQAPALFHAPSRLSVDCRGEAYL